MSTQPKMYVLVRRDLDPMYRGVQGAHALSSYALQYPDEFRDWGNSDLIFLGVRFQREIKQWHEKLERRCINHSVFTEPDQEGHMTAIACLDAGGLFKALPTA